MENAILDGPEQNIINKELDQYLAYIGFTGTADTSCNTLKELQLLHNQKFPFENLNPLLKLPVDLNLQAIGNKFLKEGRGGYCFEQNSLFSYVLKSIGFKVKGLAARVLWNLPENVIPPRGHMLLLVDVDGDPFIADVGFGGLSLTGPLKFVTDQEQETPHEPFRIVSSGEEFIIQAKIKEQWRNLYQFGLMEQLPQDYEVANYFTSNHPKSPFTYTLIAARPMPGKRYNLRNNELTIHHTNGESVKKIIKDHLELKELLTTVFGINVSKLEKLDDKLKEIVLL